jgi:hypothetical protein
MDYLMLMVLTYTEDSIVVITQSLLMKVVESISEVMDGLEKVIMTILLVLLLYN